MRNNFGDLKGLRLNFKKISFKLAICLDHSLSSLTGYHALTAHNNFRYGGPSTAHEPHGVRTAASNENITKIRMNLLKILEFGE